MSDAVSDLVTEPADLATLRARLAAWREEGAFRLDPTRFCALEALARRAADQGEPVRRLLQATLERALAQYAQRLAEAGPLAPARRASALPTAPASPLAELNAYIRAASPGHEEGAARPELASVRRFRSAWSSRRAQDRLAQASTRRPANAGPLNSHALVLDSLALMREVSPDYLQRFLAQVESLQWLERAAAQYPPLQSAAAKKPRPTRPARPPAGVSPPAARKRRA